MITKLWEREYIAGYDFLGTLRVVAALEKDGWQTEKLGFSNGGMRAVLKRLL